MSSQFQAGMNFQRGLGQKEYAAQNQNNIPAGNFVVKNAKPGFNQTHYPHQTEQQRQSGKHRQPQTEASCLISLCFGQPAHKNGNKDDVVDSQDNFQCNQRRQSNPGFGKQNPLKHGLVLDKNGLFLNKKNALLKITVSAACAADCTTNLV